MTLRAFVPLLALLGLTACAPPQATPAAPVLGGEAPASILVVPVVNRTVTLGAADACLTTLTRPVANRGYYVFPVYLVKRVLEEDGLADANLVHGADPRRLGQLFGADAILYVTLHRWDAKYAILTTQVEVELEYVLKSGRTGEELWKDRQLRTWTPQGGPTGQALGDLLGLALAATVAKAAPDYLALARQANDAAFQVRRGGLPPGPYLTLPLGK